MYLNPVLTALNKLLTRIHQNKDWNKLNRHEYLIMFPNYWQESIRTRIETCFHIKHLSTRIHITDKNPSEQGLKHLAILWASAAIFITDKNPSEQGLKLSVGAAGSTKQKILLTRIHQNKDWNIHIEANKVDPKTVLLTRIHQNKDWNSPHIRPIALPPSLLLTRIHQNKDWNNDNCKP